MLSGRNVEADITFCKFTYLNKMTLVWSMKKTVTCKEYIQLQNSTKSFVKNSL